MSADNQNGVASEDHLEYLFEVFHNFLLSELPVSHLLCFLQSKIRLVRERIHRIHKLEKDGCQQEAIKLFLDAIKESDEPGKYTAVFEALNDVGSEVIVKALLDETPNDIWHTERKAMIEIFNQNIEEKLKLDVILPNLKELFFEGDYEAIDSELAAGKTRYAIRLMLLFMHRKKSDWYLVFMNALWNNDHKALAEDIDPDFCKKKVDEANRTETPNQEKEKDSADKLVAGLPPDQAAESLTSLSTVGENYPAVLVALLSEVQSLRSDIADMKELLLKFMAGNQKN